MAEPLTRGDVRRIYREELARCKAKPLPRGALWALPCVGMKITNQRRSLGKARSDGYILITSAYIGTLAEEGLRDTIRHELAHLAAGLRAGHGPVWQAIAELFGARPEREARASEMLTELVQNMRGKLSLVAHLVDGQRVVCQRRRHRRNKRYLDYPFAPGSLTMSVRGIKVERFEYITEEG